MKAEKSEIAENFVYYFRVTNKYTDRLESCGKMTSREKLTTDEKKELVHNLTNDRFIKDVDIYKFDVYDCYI